MCDDIGLSGRSGEAQGVEKVELLRGGLAGAVEGALANMGGVFLDPREQVERGAGASVMALGVQAHAHDAVEDEGQEADHGVRADAVGQPVVDRGDLDVGFQDAEAALDVRQALVTRDGFSGGEVRGVGDQRELAVEELGLGNGVVIDRPAEPLRI